MFSACVLCFLPLTLIQFHFTDNISEIRSILVVIGKGVVLRDCKGVSDMVLEFFSPKKKRNVVFVNVFMNQCRSARDF